MSVHCVPSVDQPSPSEETTVHPCGHRLVCSRFNAWQRSSQGSRQPVSAEYTQEDRQQYAVVYFLAPPAPIVSSFLATNGLIGAAVACAWPLTACSVSSVSIASVSTPPVRAAVDVETRFGAAGCGGAGCSSWALTSTGPSSRAHRSSNRARHRSECC